MPVGGLAIELTPAERAQPVILRAPVVLRGTPARPQPAAYFEAVKRRIRELIEQEDATATLSDDRLVELLREGGVEIARRTVAKYREALRIPSSVERRRRKAFEG